MFFSAPLVATHALYRLAIGRISEYWHHTSLTSSEICTGPFASLLPTQHSTERPPLCSIAWFVWWRVSRPRRADKWFHAPRTYTRNPAPTSPSPLFPLRLSWWIGSTYRLDTFTYTHIHISGILGSKKVGAQGQAQISYRMSHKRCVER